MKSFVMVVLIGFTLASTIPVPALAQQNTSSDRTRPISNVLPLLVSAFFIGVATWVIVETWDSDEPKTQVTTWRQRRVPTEYLSFAQNRDKVAAR